MPPRNAQRREPWILGGAALLTFAPLVLYWGAFGRMFWYGDEFDLIDQSDRFGLWHWTWSPFAENFVPLFKVLWRGAVGLTGGSYLAMITLVWAIHALNVALLGRVLRRCALSWTVVMLTLSLFGLAPTHVETMTWTVQSSAVLSITFMLLALDSLVARPFRPASYAWVAASALSFSRGVLTGGLLALGGLWPGMAPGSWIRRALLSAVYLVPAVVVAGVIAVYAGGNQHHMQGHWGEAAVFGSWYYFLNPGELLLGVESRGWHTIAVLGAAKLALVAWTLVRSRGRARMVFGVFVLSDLANAVLLGIGRYHTGLDAALSSRYQYASLLGIAPLFAFWVEAQVARLPLSRLVREAALAAAVAALAVTFCVQWKPQIELYSRWRGSDSRQILLVDPAPDPYSVPGIPFMKMSRARELIWEHSLH